MCHTVRTLRTVILIVIVPVIIVVIITILSVVGIGIVYGLVIKGFLFHRLWKSERGCACEGKLGTCDCRRYQGGVRKV